MGKKIDEMNLNLGDYENSKRRITSENGDLLRQLQELNANANLMVKTKSALVAALDEQKGIADNEAKERVNLLGKFRNLEHAADGLKENYDEEVSSKENLARQLNKALGDADMWRQKYEIDGLGKAEELEMSKLKLQARLSESQATIEQLSLKLQQLEKAKSKLSANAANAESQRNIKLIQGNIRNVQSRLEEETRAKAVATDNLLAADRRCNSNQNALEEARTLLEQADRNRRMLEAELADTNESLSDQTCQNQAICGAKMKCEQEMATMGHDLDEMVSEAAMSEEKAQRAMIDAARLADELRAEQDTAMALERDKKLLEAQVKDAANRVDEAEQNALKGGKKAIAKMETRTRELESELDAESRRCNDAQKNLRKSERYIKELSYQQD